jgi:hypothetical protein
MIWIAVGCFVGLGLLALIAYLLAGDANIWMGIK